MIYTLRMQRSKKRLEVGQNYFASRLIYKEIKMVIVMHSFYNPEEI